RDFAPSPGLVDGYSTPGGPGVRLDSHLYSGYRVPPNYDSLVAKLIVHRRTREEAISCMKRALEEFSIGGIKTTIPLHLEVLSHTKFLSGTIHTGFLEDLLAGR
ncbi:MAG: acetyl-CoA carboxylase biotin carboxylase subunit, partial [Planctomycetota bacterium]